ncbi:MAG: catalase [Lachnospiraceae bacterium]|nr:catalase [Lachnospiraceae bacterium]
MKAWQHLRTILHHKNLVRKGCFKAGLYRQGMMHDWSKYSPVEFLTGCRYYQGTKSPNNAERMDKGYSAAWLHHKGRNKHHWEYWIDYSAESGFLTGMRMPVNYVVEMFIDRVSASKNYQKEKYTQESPLQYYEWGKEHYMLHDDTRELLEKLLHMLAEEGEERVYEYIRTEVLSKRNSRKKDNGNDK